MDFLLLFNKQTQSSSTNPMLSQFPFMLHLRCANPLFSLKGFTCLVVLIQRLFWFIHIVFFFILFTNSIGFVSFFFPMQHSHIHNVFKRCHEDDAMIEKQKFVQCHWLVKNGQKKQDEMNKKLSCAVTYNGGDMVKVVIGSEKLLRIRKLEILEETPFFESPS